jgi:hypothetical protein
MLAVAGVTSMDTRVGALTVRLEVPLIVPKVAVIVVVPAPAPVANPLELMVATEVEDELQTIFGSVVRSFVELSEYVPVAVNCSLVLTAISGLGWVTVMETRDTAETVRSAEPDVDPDVALIVVEPAALVVTIPLEVMVATVVLDELQVTDEVIS